MSYSIDYFYNELLDNRAIIEQALFLDIEGCVIAVRSNSHELVEQLRVYFSHIVCEDRKPTLEITAVEREAPGLSVEFIDWKREPGKTGRKDSYYDLEDARLIRKVRTGMVFLQSGRERIAAGECLRFDNQVINFINAQYMNWLQQRNWLICHAAGLIVGGKVLALAGFSGGGKSTVMLHMLENTSYNYLTNDRLFILRDDNQVCAAGIPKLPRVNPGTIVHNARLQSLISEEKRSALLALPKNELWELEEKYDVYVGEVYGEERIGSQAQLGAFVILNWKREATDLTEVHQVDLSERRDLLKAIMKSPGPFYQYSDGSFYSVDTEFEEQRYLDYLRGIPVYEVTGQVDFNSVTRKLGAIL